MEKQVPEVPQQHETQHAGLIAGITNDVVSSLFVLAATLYIRLIGWTTRTTFYGKENIPEGPFIYAFWHSRLVFFVHSHRQQFIHVLVSKSKDGQLISSIIHKFGFKTVRGSSSRAGREAALQMIRCLKENKVCAITPDGPRGPAREIKDGLSYLARKTGCPIVPIANAVKRKRLLPSWDKFVVPLPFNQALIITGEPIYVEPDADLAAANLKIGESLNRITAAADMLAENL